MEIEYEQRGIEDLLDSDNTDYIPVSVNLKNRGEFMVYITPLLYGDLPKNTDVNEFKLGQKILLEHLFKKNKEPFTLNELNKMPAGLILELIDAIKQVSGFNEKANDVADF